MAYFFLVRYRKSFLISL